MKKTASTISYTVAILAVAVILFAIASRAWAGHESDSNTWYGYLAGNNPPSGDANSFFGSEAGYHTSSGSANVFVGYQAGYNNTTGSNNTYIGQGAGLNNTAGHDNVFIGYNAGSHEDGSNKLYIDNCFSGGNCTSPLIYGEFDNRIVTINGQVILTAVASLSDMRYKRNIEPLKAPLDKVLRLTGVSYEWRVEDNPGSGFSKGRQIGLIAQDVEAVIPEVVYTNNKGYKSLLYDKLVPVLIEAVKEQQQSIAQKSRIIDEHQELIEKLTEKLKKLDKLEAKLKRLEGGDETAQK
jgi:hypothetical protein